MIKILGDEINYNLDTDKIIKAIDEPTYMTDRKREELRVTEDGTYYLHTNNDHENELIVTMGSEIDQWTEKNNEEAILKFDDIEVDFVRISTSKDDFLPVKTYYVLDYKNGNKAIREKREYEQDQINEYGEIPEHDEAIVGVIESTFEPGWKDLDIDWKTGEYYLMDEISKGLNDLFAGTTAGDMEKVNEYKRQKKAAEPATPEGLFNEADMLKKVGVRTMNDLHQIGHWNGECFTVDGMTIKPQYKKINWDNYKVIGYEITE